MNTHACTSRIAVIWLVTALFNTSHTSAQSRKEAVGTCTVDDVREASRPGWLHVNDSGELNRTFPPAENAELVPPLWTSNEGAITLHELARRAAPILIFSPLEFLRKRYPPIGVPTEIGIAQPGSDDRAKVYFRIRAIRLRSEKSARLSDAERTLIRDHETQWSCGITGTRPVDEIEYVAIRYFFYYPRDEGIGGHAHDIEAAEVQVVSRPFCVDVPLNCFYALTIESASGSAHGAGWYTNILSVKDTSDTVLPLTFIVERDKHASSPDRDGNGIYQPYYDTNKYTKDAWGIRDVVGSGWLGGAGFRGDLNDDRRAESPLFPPHTPTTLQHLYEKFTKREWGMGGTYQLLWSEKQSLCNRKLSTQGDEHRLKVLMEGKDFCGDDAIEVKRGGFGRFIHTISPGPSGRYGFMSYYQRLSFAMRHDEGVGVSMIVPVGAELKVFGGWLVPKVHYTPTWDGSATDVKVFATDLLYAATGSRVVDWYISGGGERWLDTGGKLQWGEAGEAGLKFRFNFENMRKFIGFQFFGFRLGVRTTHHRQGADTSDWNTRIVFEAGAGSW